MIGLVGDFISGIFVVFKYNTIINGILVTLVIYISISPPITKRN